jgi:aldose sugar dehydrogenase
MKCTPSTLLLAVSLGTGLIETAARAQDTSRGAQLYQQACATCHGAELQGGNAQSLVDGVWQFGAGRGSMLRNMKYGIPDFSMPAFEHALSDAEMNQVIDYILQAEKKADAPPRAVPTQLFTTDYELKVEVVAEGLDVPWGIDFLDERTALITERTGRLRLLVDGKLQSAPIAGTPKVSHEGQGGLLDVAIDPEYSKEGWIYLVYSHALEGVKGKDRAPSMTRLVRGRIKNHQWVDEQIVYEAPHDLHLETRHHYGSRIVFDAEGYLYFSIGDRGIAPHAQDLRRPNGKVHRIHRDGRIPADNPFVGVPDALPSIFTWGNRNAQGLAVHPHSGAVWATEHGPMGGDELNLLAAGKNYGWPVVSHGRNYDGAPISGLREKPGVQAPVLYWTPSIAVCGMDFIRGEAFPRWRNRLLVAALKYEEIRLLDVQEDRVLHQQIVLKNAGRVRDVACAPDGSIYAVLNGPDRVLRLSPVRDLNPALDE